MSANHKPKKWRGIEIEVGQFITSRDKLAAELPLSVQQVRTALNKLKSTGEITIKTTTKYSIISITNWCEYQISNQQANQQVTNKQPTSNQQVTTNNNDNNANNVNNDNKKPIPAKKKKQQEIIVIEYPDDLNKEAWLMWIDHRKEAKLKKLTSRGEKIGIKQLIAMGGHADQLLIIECSMSNGYTGLFPLKKSASGKSDENAEFRRSIQANNDAIAGYCYDSK